MQDKIQEDILRASIGASPAISEIPKSNLLQGWNQDTNLLDLTWEDMGAATSLQHTLNIIRTWIKVLEVSAEMPNDERRLKMVFCLNTVTCLDQSKGGRRENSRVINADIMRGDWRRASQIVLFDGKRQKPKKPKDSKKTKQPPKTTEELEEIKNQIRYKRVIDLGEGGEIGKAVDNLGFRQ
jgi:hypothetical protein